MSLQYRKHPFWRYVLTVVLLVLLFVLMNFLSKEFDAKYNKNVVFASFLQDKMHEISNDKPHAVNLGGSIGKSLHLAMIGFSKGVNLAFINQDLSENEVVMDTLLAMDEPSLNTFFIAIDPMGLLLNNEWSNVKSRRLFYSAMYPYRGLFLIDRDLSNFIVGVFFPLVRADSWFAPAKYLLNKLTGINFSLDNTKIKRDETILTEDGRSKAINNVNMALNKIDQGQYYFPDDSEKAKNAVIRMCKKSHENNKKMILYVPPITDLYKNITLASKHADLANRLWQQVVEQCQAYNATVMRFDNDEAFQHSYELFKDTNHLNEKGALYFSKLFGERLKQIQ